MDIKFSNLAQSALPVELLNYIYKNNYYQLNTYMVKTLVKRLGKFNQSDFDTRNYYFIKNSTCSELIAYVAKNINEYVVQIYLQLDNNTQEDENCLIELLNGQNLNTDNKTKVILKTETKISSINRITEVEVGELLLDRSLVLPTWVNIYDHYVVSGEVLSDATIVFLNNEENIDVLSKLRIPKGSGEDVDKYKKFIRSLVLSDDISDDAYFLMLSSIPYSYPNLEFGTLSDKKVLALINSKTLTLSEKSFTYLKDNCGGLHIRLIEANKADFIAKISSYDLNRDDVSGLLKSQALSDEEKSTLLDSIDEALVISNGNSLKGIGQVLLRNNGFIVSDSILMRVLMTNKLSLEERIKAFNLRFNRLDNTYITEFLTSLEEPFSNIAIKGKKPLLPKNDWSLRLAVILRDRGYISSFNIKEKGIKVQTYIRD